MKALDLAALLGKAGAAVSPENSWQEQLGTTAGDMASAEQDRRFLSELLGGGVPDPSGRTGLSPKVVLQGLRLKNQIEQSRPEPEPMVPVSVPWKEEPELVPAEGAADYRKDVWKQQQTTAPSGIRTFREFQQMDEETQKDFLEFSKTQRGKSFEEALAEYLTKRKEAAKQDKEMEAKLELGTSNHYDDVVDRLDSNFLSRQYEKRQPKVSPDVFYDQMRVQKMAEEIEDRNDDLSNVKYKNGPEGVGFYGTRNGKEILFKKFSPPTR